MKMLQFSNYNPITGGTNRYYLLLIFATAIAIGTVIMEIRNDAKTMKQIMSIVFALLPIKLVA